MEGVCGELAARTMLLEVQSFFVGKRRQAWRSTEPRGNCVVVVASRQVAMVAAGVNE